MCISSMDSPSDLKSPKPSAAFWFLHLYLQIMKYILANFASVTNQTLPQVYLTGKI